MAKKQFTNCILLLFSLLWANDEALETNSAEKLFVCPSPEKIFPCVCFIDGNYPLGNLTCSGSSVGQESIDQLFSEVQAVNRLNHQNAKSNLFDISAFYLESTTLAQLNVAPLTPFNFGILSLNFLTDLKQIVSESNVTTGNGLIGAKNIFLQSRWTDNTTAQLLQHIQPDGVKTLELGSNKVGLSTKIREIISNLTRLEYLNLNGNQIPKILGNHNKTKAQLLKLSWRLASLNLSSCELVELGQHAFFFENKRDPNEFDWDVTIDLSNNFLTHDSIHPNSGLTSIARPTSLSLENNFLEFLSNDKFQRFLDANPWNNLRVNGNPFICDHRMSWLVKGRDVYEGRIEGVKCSNDPEGKNIFETNLI